MHNPPHPGEIIREECINALGLSVTAAAKILGVSRKTVSMLLNERAGVSPDMAIRLSKAFGSSARVWLGLQMAYDLWQAEQHADEIDVKRYEPA
jgi:addiction module HigA family antidote